MLWERKSPVSASNQKVGHNWLNSLLSGMYKAIIHTVHTYVYIIVSGHQSSPFNVFTPKVTML